MSAQRTLIVRQSMTPSRVICSAGIFLSGCALAAILVWVAPDLRRWSQRPAIARVKIGKLEDCLRRYQLDHHGAVPPAEAGLRLLVSSGLPEAEILLVDPWGEPVQYWVPSKRSNDRFDVFSKGRNRVAGDDDDIGNWSP